MAAGRRAQAGNPRSAAGGDGAADQGDAHAHLYVFAQGGTPHVYVDGVSQRVAAPALVQVTPGRHTVQVRGLQPFEPSDTTIVLAAEDTQTVIFRQARAAQPRAGNAAGTQEAGNRAGRANTLPAMDWDDWTQKLGFDPRTVDTRTLTPAQRQRYRRFQQAVDSVRRAARRP